VAAPVTWQEAKTVAGANVFTLSTMPKRIRGVGDPWAGYFDVRQSVTKTLIKAVNAA
jgi:DNA primase